jgi:hypothetical protein
MTTSKTIAALLGPTLVASAISLLANLGTSRTIIEGLSQSPALIMIAGYAAFVPGLAIVYFHNRWTGGWPMLVTVMGWLSLVVGLLRMVFPHTNRRTNDENRSVRGRRLSCRRGRIPADRRIPFVQGIRSRVTTPAVLGGSASFERIFAATKERASLSGAGDAERPLPDALSLGRRSIRPAIPTTHSRL